MAKTEAFIIEALTARSDQCILWPFAKLSGGYGAIKRDGRTLGAHRVVCERAHGPSPEGQPEAAHRCGVSGCVNPLHIRWASAQENQRDRLGHGTSNRGERYGASKLTAEIVRSIRIASAAGAQQRDLAALHGVSQVTISNVVTRTSWAWLD